MNKKAVQVVVAVIRYQGWYLLAWRDGSKHQGNKFEFVGGKIEQGESELMALTREIKEELGLKLDLSLDVDNKDSVGFISINKKASISKLGNIYHDYGDKAVCLAVFCIELTKEQFLFLQSSPVGAENQPIFWYDLPDLLGLADKLPKANRLILDWLTQDKTA